MTKYVFIYFLGIIVTILSTYIGYHIFGKLNIEKYKPNNKWLFIMVSGSALVYFVVFSTMKDLTVMSHHSFYDFAVFLDYFHHFSQNKGLFSSLEEATHPGGGYWMGVHFTPLAYFFAFFYKILPSFRTINWLQTILIATSPIILYSFGRRFLGVFGAFCISMALLLNPTFQYITLYEFGYLRFIIPAGILALGVTLRGYPVLFVFLSSFVVLLIREDAAFMIFGIGLFIFFFQRERRWVGSTLMIVSPIYLIVLLKVIMPIFRGNSDMTSISLFQDFGKTLPEIFKTILLNPAKLFVHLFHPFKLINWIMYILPFSFVPLIGADVLVIMLPTLVMLSFSGSVTHTSYFLYYVAPILVVMVWSTVMGIPRLVKLAETKERLKKWLRRYPPSIGRISFAVLIGSLACSIYFGPSPISIQFWFRQFSLAPFRTNTFYMARYQPSEHDEIINKIARLIPENASASTEQFLVQNVYKSKLIYVFPYIEGAEYIFIDKKNPLKTGSNTVPDSWHGLRQNPQFYYDWVEKRPDVFELVYSEDGVFLYKRRLNAPAYPQPYDTP